MIPTTAWLYGSVARGDYDDTSDLDILVIADEGSRAIDVDNLGSHLPQSQYRSVRTYSWAEIEGMAAYGSLFLRHLYLEGQPLTSGPGTERFDRILQTLRPYAGTKRDLKGFAVALDDVERSLGDGGDPAFELGIIATVIRHSSILASYHLGRDAFARRRSIPETFVDLGMADVANSALELYGFRLRQSRGLLPTTAATVALADEWLSTSRRYLRRMKETICDSKIAS